MLLLGFSLSDTPKLAAIVPTSLVIQFGILDLFHIGEVRKRVKNSIELRKEVVTDNVYIVHMLPYKDHSRLNVKSSLPPRGRRVAMTVLKGFWIAS